MIDLKELYQDVIVDHNRRPRNFRRMDDADRTAEGFNPLCGDKLKVYFAIDESGRISDARFEGSGCAISVASASLLTDTVIGLSTDRALAYFRAMVERLAQRKGSAIWLLVSRSEPRFFAPSAETHGREHRHRYARHGLGRVHCGAARALGGALSLPGRRAGAADGAA